MPPKSSKRDPSQKGGAESLALLYAARSPPSNSVPNYTGRFSVGHRSVNITASGSIMSSVSVSIDLLLVCTFPSFVMLSQDLNFLNRSFFSNAVSVSTRHH